VFAFCFASDAKFIYVVLGFSAGFRYKNDGPCIFVSVYADKTGFLKEKT
jgi:hypothetical protein